VSKWLQSQRLSNAIGLHVSASLYPIFIIVSRPRVDQQNKLNKNAANISGR